jgi:hypothetical protein
VCLYVCDLTFDAQNYRPHTSDQPPELVPAVAAAFARACESASAPAIAAAADALAALVSKDDPEVIELFVRFGSMGFLLLPTERDVVRRLVRSLVSVPRLFLSSRVFPACASLGSHPSRTAHTPAFRTWSVAFLRI